MLRSLHIENIAVIRQLDLDLGNGFSVLTGETGAGKSILIDSINLLLCNRVPGTLIRRGETVATVRAVFEDLSEAVSDRLEEIGFPCQDRSLLLQRNLFADGRSKVRINGQAVTQSVLKELAPLLISIHGQTDNQRLLQRSAHLSLLDAYAHPESARKEYESVYQNWQAVRKQLSALSRDEAELLRRSEMLQFQISDIDSMQLKDGEEETLLRERDRLLHSEQIQRQANLAVRALRGGDRSGALDLIRRAQGALRSLHGIAENAETLSERLASAMSEIEDIASYAEAFLEDEEIDPTEQIDRVEGRLDGISKLKRKYGDSISKILAFREQAEAEWNRLVCSDEERVRLEMQEETLRAQAEACAEVLTTLRTEAAREITERVNAELRFLDMPKVRFEIRLERAELGPSGWDTAEFFIATNPGEPLQPMLKIASGGELSRIMLALRSVLNDRDGADTVIFDEVDTGISGKTSRKVGIKLAESAAHTQVICVTHSAQIASLADHHYCITKSEVNGRADTEVSLLNFEGRVEEIARILGGIQITDVQRAAARQMIEEYRGRTEDGPAEV